MTEPVNLFAIAGAVSQVFKITRLAIAGNSREHPVVRARFVSAHLMRDMRPDVTLDRIGALLGRRDHTTVINAYRQGSKLAKLYPDVQAKIDEAREIACSWRVGEPLPGFYGEAPVPQPVKLGRPPKAEFEAVRAVDKTIVNGLQCTADYATENWYLQNDRRFSAVMAKVHPELLVQATFSDAKPSSLDREACQA